MWPFKEVRTQDGFRDVTLYIAIVSCLLMRCRSELIIDCRLRTFTPVHGPSLKGQKNMSYETA